MTTELQLNPQDVQAIIQTAPAVLTRNQEAIDRINANADKLMLMKTEKGMSAELDKLMNDYLVKVREAMEAAKNRRTPLTKMFDEVKSRFTAIEAAMDAKKAGTKVNLIQEARNEWAKTLADLEAKRQREELLKRNMANEITGLKYDIEMRFREHFKILLNTQLTDLQNAFNGATLGTFERASDQVRAWPETYPHGHFASFNPDFTMKVIYNEKSIADKLVEEFKGSGFYDVLYNEYLKAIQDKKQTLVDMLPGKLDSLNKAEQARIAAEKAEEERKAQEIARAKAEQEARVAASAAEAEAARARAEQARKDAEIAEANRLRLLEEEKARQAEEDARKKELEQKALAEQAERDEAATKEAERRKAAQEAQDLFSSHSSSAQAIAEQPAAGQVRTGYEILVKAPHGWMLILNLWFQHEGGKLALDKFEKKSLGSIKSWCEKHAQKTGEKIASPLVEYKETFTAVSTS